MKENKKQLFITLGVFVFAGASAIISVNSNTSHKQKVLDSFLTENTVLDEEVSFEQQKTDVKYEIQPTYTIITSDKPNIVPVDSPDVDLSMQKVADPSQRYHETDEYFFVRNSTEFLEKDTSESESISTLSFADYVHVIGKDIYNDDGFSLVEINGKKGFVETQKLTSEILFKLRDKTVYPYEDVDVYDSETLEKVIMSTPRIHGIQMIGESANVIKVKIDDKIGFIDKAKISQDMLFDDAWSEIWTLADIDLKKEPADNAEALTSVRKYSCIQRAGVSEEWTKIQLEDGSFGYTRSENLSVERPISKGEEIVNFALQFVGNPYVYGGTSLTNGTDCSGFTQSVYAHFGYSLNRTSSSQRSNGWAVSYEDLRPGDLVFYSGHVTIYIGNGQIVHASNSAPYPQGGIKISNVNYAPIEAIRRIVD